MFQDEFLQVRLTVKPRPWEAPIISEWLLPEVESHGF